MMAREISLFGYGKTTRAISKRLGPCTFYDDRIAVPHSDDAGNRLLPPLLFEPDRSELQIPSPGFPPDHPLIRQSHNLISEYDLFLSDAGAELLRQPRPYTVWVSGTNGKTTTTRMITHLLADRGAVSGGNIGTPLAELDAHAPIWVLETSSFTLHYTRHAKPDLYLLLPVTPDHLGWHGGEAAYLADKLKPLARMREGEAILLPADYADTPTHGFVIPYSDRDTLARYFGIDMQKVRFDGVFLLDALLALGVAKILFDEIDYEKINAFRPDPHRQERLTDRFGRLWIDDSKATNVDATLQALAPYRERTIHLILGGDDKGVDLDPLFSGMEGYDVTIYAIGSNAGRLDAMASRYARTCHLCGTLEEAVAAIDSRHDSRSVALLSPAAASLDQFASYAERGARFKEIISKL